MSWTKEKPTQSGWYAVLTPLSEEPKLRFLHEGKAYFDKSVTAPAAESYDYYDKFFFLGDGNVELPWKNSLRELRDGNVELPKDEAKPEHFFVYHEWEDEDNYDEVQHGFEKFTNREDLINWLRQNYQNSMVVRVITGREASVRFEVTVDLREVLQ